MWLAWPQPGRATEVATGELTPSGGRNAPEHLGKPRVVLVSIDGLRHDFPDRYDMPTLQEIGRRGVRAAGLIPPFPSLTFPGHYTIATGLKPGRHGIVANRFLDPRTGRRYSLRDAETVQDGWWYAGEPIWVTAETQGMVAAAFYFVGTEADVGGIRPSDWRPFDMSVPGEERVDRVLAWLAEPPETRPHVITLYFGLVDAAGHEYGPDAPETVAAVAGADALLGRLLSGIDGLRDTGPIYLVVVSDHGVMPYDRDAPRFVVDDLIDMAGVRTAVGGPVLFLHLDDPRRAASIRDAVNAAWDDGRAWLPAETPPAWGVAGNPRFGDVILTADPGHAVVSGRLRDAPLPLGSHGWPPEVPEMRGVFFALGPGLPAGASLDAVDAVDVYPFLARLLDLRAAGDLDGSPAGLADRVLPAGDSAPVRAAP
jgi:predicted AlkP superfamily pyrophosphatase or phosphodiesterase